MKKTRAKFFLTAKTNDDGSMTLSGWPVTSGCEENKVFNEFTPGGNLSIHIAKDAPAQANFEPNVAKEYYVDITEAPVVDKKTSDSVEDQATKH